MKSSASARPCLNLAKLRSLKKEAAAVLKSEAMDGVFFTAPRVACELCGALLTDLTLLERELHVNECLDNAEDYHHVAAPAPRAAAPAPLPAASGARSEPRASAFAAMMGATSTNHVAAPAPRAALSASSEPRESAFAVMMRSNKTTTNAFAVMKAAAANTSQKKGEQKGVKRRRGGGGGGGGGMFGGRQQHPNSCPVQKRVEGTSFLVDAFTYCNYNAPSRTRQAHLLTPATRLAAPAKSSSATAASPAEAFDYGDDGDDDAADNDEAAGPAWPISNAYQFLLTHFHADHYGGLSNKVFAQSAQRDSKIWCTAATAALVRLNLSIPPKRLRIVPFDVAVSLPLPAAAVRAGRRATMTLIDANHCPGAAIALFKIWRARSDGEGKEQVRAILHTGDFRFHAGIHAVHPALAPYTTAAAQRRLRTVHLDTTYCDAQYTFPPQRLAIDAAVEAVRKEMVGGVAARPRKRGASKGLGRPIVKKPAPGGDGSAGALFLFGAYSLGKERLFLEVARTLGVKLCVSKTKMKMLRAVAEADDVFGLQRSFAAGGGGGGGGGSALSTTAIPLRSPAGMMPPRSSFLKADLALLTEDETATRFHVVSMGDLNVKACQARLKKWEHRYSRVVSIRPTGWAYTPGRAAGGKQQYPSSSSASASPPPAVITKRECARGTVTKYSVAYSEHSSFNELQGFVEHFAPSRSGVRVLPTVNCKYGSLEGDVARQEMVGRLRTVRPAMTTKGSNVFRIP